MLRDFFLGGKRARRCRLPPLGSSVIFTVIFTASALVPPCNNHNARQKNKKIKTDERPRAARLVGLYDPEERGRARGFFNISEHADGERR